ncbi:chitin disaccharide deacetylase [Actinomycetes bacterium NPDC127524]
MIHLIVNADDFGYSRGVNYGILDSHLLGIVNSATMMMNMEGTEHAIQLAKEHPSLKTGIHLVLTCGRPLLTDVRSLTDQNGNFKKQSQLLKDGSFSLDEIEREWSVQIEAFLSSGLEPTHLDSHHHMHGTKEIMPVAELLSKKYGLPLRKTGNGKEGVSYFSGVFLDDFYGEGATEDYFNKLHEKVSGNALVEVMCHPAYLDTSIMEGSSYNLARLRETLILTNTVLPKNIALAKL